MKLLPLFSLLFAHIYLHELSQSLPHLEGLVLTDNLDAVKGCPNGSDFYWSIMRHCDKGPGFCPHWFKVTSTSKN